MNKEPKTIETPEGKVAVVIKTWTTARDTLAIRGVYMMDLRFKVNTSKANDPKQIEKDNEEQEFSGDLVQKAERVTLEHYVLSVGDNSTDIYEKLLDLSPDDYDFVKKAVDEVTKGANLSDPKKTSSAAPTQS